MAVTVVFNQNQIAGIDDSPKYFIGLAGDTKPTVASHDGLPTPTVGSKFLEYDTDIISITYDGTTWVVVDLLVRLLTGTAAFGRVGHDTTALGHGVKTISTVATDEVLAASTACKWVIIQAQTDNTSKVAVGATGVDATVATGNGVILEPGDTVTLLVDNLADVYVDALVAGEGCRYTYGS